MPTQRCRSSQHTLDSGLRVVREAGRKKDGVRVAVDDLEAGRVLQHGYRGVDITPPIPLHPSDRPHLGELAGALQDLSALRRDKGSQRPRIEARLRKAEAAVHGIGEDFERLLTDVQCLLRHRVLLRLEHPLDSLALPHKRLDDCGENCEIGVLGSIRELGELNGAAPAEGTPSGSFADIVVCIVRLTRWSSRSGYTSLSLFLCWRRSCC